MVGQPGGKGGGGDLCDGARPGGAAGGVEGDAGAVLQRGADPADREFRRSLRHLPEAAGLHADPAASVLECAADRLMAIALNGLPVDYEEAGQGPTLVLVPGSF